MTTAQKVIATAKAEIGYHEGRSGGHWNNDQKYSDQLPGFAWSDFQAWCATFVCWSFWKSGVYDLLTTPSAGVDQLSAGFKRDKRWSDYPAIGAVAFYGKPSDLNHTGIVADYDSDYIYVVEGNTNDSGSREGDGVYLKKRARRDDYVVGYGYPDYPEGIKSADPDWREAEPPAPAPRVATGTRGKRVDHALHDTRAARKIARHKGQKFRVSVLTKAINAMRKLKAR